MPLNPDAYFSYTLGKPGGLIIPSIGLLVSGKARSTLSIPPMMVAGLEGQTLHHAYVVLSLSPLSFSFASHSVPLLLEN